MIVRVVLAIAILLGGCSTQQKIIQSFDRDIVDNHVRHLTSIENWKISGRLSVKTEKGGQIGRLHWNRNSSHHRIDIYGSLSSGHMRILSKPNEVVLLDSEGAQIVGGSVREVLDEYIGWQFPAEELESWVIGKPYPRASYTMEWDTSGRIMFIEQAGWRVKLSRYDQFNDYQLPTHLRLSATEEVQREISQEQPHQSQPSEIRLVISHWTVN